MLMVAKRRFTQRNYERVMEDANAEDDVPNAGKSAISNTYIKCQPADCSK